MHELLEQAKKILILKAIQSFNCVVLKKLPNPS